MQVDDPALQGGRGADAAVDRQDGADETGDRLDSRSGLCPELLQEVGRDVDAEGRK